MIKLNRRHKDSIFCALFSDKENFLSLYNALHETNLKLEDTEIREIRIPQTMYSTRHNDVSMLINNRIIVLIEHQSTINENMPLRCLEYITRIYEILLKNENRYRKEIIPLPTPEFYVFYNGEQPYPDNTVLKLSDAFIYHNTIPPLELKVTVKNIAFSTKPESILKIMDYCSIIKQYTQFIELVRKYKNNRRGLKRAVDEAIKQGILVDFLEENFKEVVNMLCARYSYKTDVRINAEEMAHHLAKEYAKDIAKDMAKDIAKDIAKDMAKEYAKDMAKDIAKHMLDDNMSMEQVMKYSSLSEEEIKSL